MVAALYTVSAVRMKNGQRARELRFDTTTNLLDVPPLLEAHAADFASQDDVLVDLTANPA